uniref:Uncharacterized protein n=1 Tax=Arundo donax TaxID=35708 RepID=A0A0A9FYQ6_ARUDO
MTYSIRLTIASMSSVERSLQVTSELTVGAAAPAPACISAK